MRYQQLIFWFIAYSVLIAGTAISAQAFFREQNKRFRPVFFLEISLLFMVSAVFMIVYLFEQVGIKEIDLVYAILELCFYLGLASCATFLLTIPETVCPGTALKASSRVLSTAPAAGFALYLAVSLYNNVISQPTDFLLIVLGLLKLYLFLFLVFSSLRALLLMGRRWPLQPLWLRNTLLVTGGLLILAILFVDIIYGAWFSQFHQRELSLFYCLPIYSILLSSFLAAFVLRSSRKESGASKGMAVPADWGISPREEEVLHLLMEGKSYQETADSLFISLATVQSHVRSLYRKAGVNSKMALSHKLKGKT